MMTIFWFIVLILSIVLHELAHGYAAYFLGDPTAKEQGRLSLNPIRHLDPLGSFLVPLLCFLSGSGFMLGWAKPVPVTPRFFQSPDWGMLWVALAGPLVNVFVAILFAFMYHFSIGGHHHALLILSLYGVQINLVLALFNLLPIPPLDGSRILYPFLPYQGKHFFRALEPYGIALLFILFYFDGFSFFVLPVFHFVLTVFFQM